MTAKTVEADMDDGDRPHTPGNLFCNYVSPLEGSGDIVFPLASVYLSVRHKIMSAL